MATRYADAEDDQPTAARPLTECAHPDTTANDDEQPGDMAEMAPPLPPDGGWGWAVVAASFSANLILDGVCYTFGVIMPKLLEHFQAGKGKTALVGSMLPGCYLLVGKIITVL